MNMPQDDPAIDQILSRFPGPIVIHSLTLGSVAPMALLMAVFVMVLELSVFDGPYLLPKVIPGLVGLAAFLLTLFIGAGHIRLDGAGFEVVSPFNMQSIAWKNVEAFEIILTSVGKGGRAPLVYCRVRHSPSPGDPRQFVVGRNFLSRSLDDMALTPDDLARLMTLWRDRAMALPIAAGTTAAG